MCAKLLGIEGRAAICFAQSRARIIHGVKASERFAEITGFAGRGIVRGKVRCGEELDGNLFLGGMLGIYCRVKMGIFCRIKFKIAKARV